MKIAMVGKGTLVGLTALGALVLNAAPAVAQVEAGSQEVDIYAGEFFGGDLTDTAISGRKPTLNDDLTYGFRYGYNFTDSWGTELSLGNTATSVSHLPRGDRDFDLSTLDIDAVWHFNSGTRLVPYVLAGVGYASSNLDNPIRGTVNGRPVAIGDDDGFTLNAGAGLKYLASDRVLVRLDARYRYLDSVTNRFDNSMNTVETTLGVGWRF
ncbi:MAG TPA: porin family protein [Steroidobacteraceae bacterium]